MGEDMTQRFPKFRLSLSAVIAAAAVLLLAAPSMAGTMYFAEMLTASQLTPAANIRATLDAGIVSKDPFNILFDGQITPDAGLGDGYLSGRGDVLSYTHRFTPAMAWDRVTAATLVIGTMDDQLFDGREEVAIVLAERQCHSLPRRKPLRRQCHRSLLEQRRRARGVGHQQPRRLGRGFLEDDLAVRDRGWPCGRHRCTAGPRAYGACTLRHRHADRASGLTTKRLNRPSTL